MRLFRVAMQNGSPVGGLPSCIDGVWISSEYNAFVAFARPVVRSTRPLNRGDVVERKIEMRDVKTRFWSHFVTCLSGVPRPGFAKRTFPIVRIEELQIRSLSPN